MHELVSRSKNGLVCRLIMEPTHTNNCTVVFCICLKLHKMDIDVTFSVTCELSFVVSTSTGRDRGSGQSAAALLCLWRGWDKLWLENVTPQGGIVFICTGLKNPDSSHITGNSQRMLKGQNMKPIQGECIVSILPDCFKLLLSLIHTNVMKPSAMIWDKTPLFVLNHKWSAVFKQ